MTLPSYIDRFIQPRVEECLRDTPVVLIHGPRRCGKTTLARHLGETHGHAYLSFDDEAVLEAAREDPVGFVTGLPERVILDEVQRIPELFTSIKLVVDRERTPGRFILSGSANVLLLPKLSDSLAGRMAIIRLHPLSRCELLGRESRFLERLSTDGFAWRRTERLGDRIAEIVAVGGYPEALSRTTDDRRQAWSRDYIETIVQRDILDLARIRGQEILPDLLTAAADKTAQIFNLADLAAPFSLSRPTIRDYVTLLERIFLIHRLRSWHSNALSRLVKSPKLHVGDTGLACTLLDLTADDLRADRKRCGQLLETFVVQEIRRQTGWSARPPRLAHFRDRDGVEVDLVLEFGPNRVAAVEVKLSATVRATDFRGIKKIQAALGDRFVGGVVLYDGEDVLPFGEKLKAVPVGCVWDDPGEM
jgi:predicted AAA+ superfamily ATPase